MTKLPTRPPTADALRSSLPSWQIVPAGTLLFRVYPRGGLYPTAWNHFRTWGPTGSRFDHHLPGPDGKGCDQARSILYASPNLETCLAEYFQARRMIDRTRDDVTVVAFETTRDLRLLDLWGPWSTRMGASGAISSGPRETARTWARALYEAFPDADGVHYESSMHARTPAVALWDGASNALPSAPKLHRLLADPDLWTATHNAATKLGYRIL